MSTTRTMERDRAADQDTPDFGEWVPPDEAPTGNLPAVRNQDRGDRGDRGGGQQQNASADPAAQRARIAAIIQSAENKRADIEPFLRAQHVTWELFIAGFKRAFMREPKLVDATPASLLQAVMELARVGHVPDGKRAAIVSFYDTKARARIATAIVMYQGIAETLYKGGQITKAHAQVVYEGEEAFLEYDLGDQAFVRFNPPLNRDDTKKIVGAFAVATNKAGQSWVEVMGAKELAKVRAVSKAASGPGKEWPGEMAKKAPFRRLAKYLPQTPELVALLELDDQSYLAAPPPATPERVASAMPNAALLADEAYTPPAADDGLKPEEEQDDSPGDQRTAVEIAEAMLEDAGEDLELLDTRYEDIKSDPDWGFAEMDVEDRARLEMVVHRLRGDAGGDQAPPELQITTAEGKSTTFSNADEWASRILAKVALPRNERIDAWWERNTPNVRAGILRAPAHAARILTAAVAKGLPGADDLQALL